jgi:hypothetical protein
LQDYLNRKPAAFIPCSDLETPRSNPGSAMKIKSNRKELKGPLQGQLTGAIFGQTEGRSATGRDRPAN